MAGHGPGLTVVSNLFDEIVKTPPFKRVLKGVEEGNHFSIESVSSSAQSFVAAALHASFKSKPLVIVTAGVKQQETLQQEMETWLTYLDKHGSAQDEIKVHYFPSWEILPNESKLPHADVISERLETLQALIPSKSKNAPLVVTNVIALLQKTFPLGVLESRTKSLKKGDQLDPLDLIEWLEEQSYEPEAQVTMKGHMSLRGGIVDVFPLTSPWPVRLEFFGDTLESLRTFDPQTQISREEIDVVVLPPGGELGILRATLADKSNTEGLSRFATLLDYLPEESLLLFIEPEQLQNHVSEYFSRVPENDPFFISFDTLKKQAVERKMHWIGLDSGAPPDTESPLFMGLDVFRPIGEHRPEAQIAEVQRREFFLQIHRWLRQDYNIQVFCNTDGEKQRFFELWEEYGFHRPIDDGGKGPALPMPSVHLGGLNRGFLYEPSRTVVITDAEIFGRYKVQRPRRLKTHHAVAARSALDINFAELEEGDFVVHLQYGIGKYLGLQLMPLSRGRKGSAESDEQERQECLAIEYAASDPTAPAPKLYVPVTEAYLVSKYVGAGKVKPPLNTLSGQRWAKTKAQAEHAVKDLASQFLSIQAARESQTGHSFPTDTPWQREFENSFPYEETPDQARAIDAAKKDMESGKPMDRLICGDVGFGKTEVAIRSAFKSVMGGKQVAILVPTTVLAQQHFNTFRDRMADYPVKVDLLSRFRTRKEQQKVIEDLASGAVDIVVGTHRLVQNDVVFKDLGLVVIDEEQRFGVMHKEKFKMLRKLVDVLTLSATPIPRTLYLALTGARDMSTIETAPLDRLPVETIITQYDERLVRDAIQRELNRQGQIFYLHNRVMDIDSVAIKLQALVPHAKILVGHGQMDPDDLERVMTAFINGEADILLSTTIIESGIDIPNANTIIIDRADKFGLSDLYQLRGRVGRYKHQAYAYLLIPRHAGLLSDARKRITAIKQYSSLGSGFKIAMRDLEIRGAGNLLGAQQSGHITAVGFELYCQLLKQSVSALKGEKVKPRVDTQVRIDFLALNTDEITTTKPVERPKLEEPEFTVPREVSTYKAGREAKEHKPKTVARTSAFIPFSYIEASQHRIDIYRKLAQVSDKAGLTALQNEMRDRFGLLPPSVELLLLVAELKTFASEKQISMIETREDKLMLTRNNDFIMIAGKFPRLVKTTAKARLNEIRKLLMAL
ncbi:MAG: mfd: transcription-repair coupling factor [Verrucomicrobiales bacterium]|nr:mfd: transcription-repair coupling factor [Verrucomicrobiales bacterium]